MNEKLKHFNLGFVKAGLLPPIWEYTKMTIPECPVIFSYSPNTMTINVGGSDSLEKRIKVENIPDGIEIIRYSNQTNAIYILSPDIISFVIHYPEIDEFKLLDKAVKATIFKTLKKYGIPLIRKNNDVYFLKDGLEKKFLGIMENSFIDGWKSMIFSITLKFDSELANKIYKLDDEKFTKKGDIANIGKIVGGLCEIKPDIDRDEVIVDVIQKIADRFDLSIERSSLTKNELSKMNKLADKFNNRGWQLYGKRP